MKACLFIMCSVAMLLGLALAQGVSESYDYRTYQEDNTTHDSAGGGYSSYSYDPIANNSDDRSSSEIAGFFPVMSYVEMFGTMKYKKGSGHAKVTNWMTVFDFVNMSKGRWGFNADGAFRMTWVNGSRDAELDVDRLFTIWTNLNITYRLFGSTKLSVSLTPQWSSDFDSWVSDNFFMGGNAMLSGKWNDSIRYAIGAGYVPQFGDSPWVPYAGVMWKLNDRWTLDLMAPRFSLINKVSDGFSWGPFFSITSGTWTVKRNRRHERFEWRSCSLGIFTSTGLGRWGKVHPKLLVDAGVSCWNRGRFLSANGDTKYASYRFEPGFYMRFGVQLAF